MRPAARTALTCLAVVPTLLGMTPGVVAMVSIAAADPQDDPAPQGCGDLAPFDRDCDDPRLEAYHPDAVPGYSYLGFIGRMELTLRQDLPSGLTVKKEWSCDLFLLNGPAPVFTPVDACDPRGRMSPPYLHDLVRGHPAKLSCTVKGYAYLGTLPVGAWGPWGCKLFMNY